ETLLTCYQQADADTLLAVISEPEKMREHYSQHAGLRRKCPAAEVLAGLTIRRVGAPGFEPGTFWSQTRRATGLRYAPPMFASLKLASPARLSKPPAGTTRREDATPRPQRPCGAHSSLARALSAGMKIASASSYRTSRLPAIWCRMRPFAPSCAALLRSARSTSARSEEHTSELQSLAYLVCRLLLEKKN